MQVNERATTYKQISASTNCIVSPKAKGGSAVANDVGIQGIFVSAASATPTITVHDSATTTTSVTIVSVFTPVAGTYYPMPFPATDGIYVVISGTVSCTVGVTGPLAQ